MKTLVGVAAAILIAVGFWVDFSDKGAPLTTASISASNVAKLITITKADWHRDGIGGAVAVAEFGVRNNADYAIRIDTVTCRFPRSGNDVEVRSATTYEIVQPQSQRVIRNLGFGFIDADLKSDCTVARAQKA